MALNYERLVELYERHEPAEATDVIKSLFETKEIRADNIPFGRLFEACFGSHEYAWAKSAGKDYSITEMMAKTLTEADGAVGTSAFLNITGQIIYSWVMDAYNIEESVFTQLIPEQPTQFLEGEKLPRITHIGDEVQVRNEFEPYAQASFGEDWVHTPPVKDRGNIVGVSWEAVFADRTNQVKTRAAGLGQWLKYNRESRAVDCIIDENSTAHRYMWRSLTGIATYGDNSGTHTWDNLAATNTLVDWSNLNTVEQLFNNLLDPYTSTPIMVEPKHLIVTKQLEQTARRILRAGEIRVTSPGYATTTNPTQTIVANPYSNKYELVTSRLLASRLATDTDWFLGDVSKYALYMVAEPMAVLQAPPNSAKEFYNRIVLEYRANERGAYTVIEPRAMCKSTVA